MISVPFNSFLINHYRILKNIFFFFLVRDFAAANMIGATGLKGKSWPDLDMLPLGWLTDPGYKNFRFTFPLYT